MATKHDVTAMLADRQSGMLLRELAAKYGLTLSNVHKMLHNLPGYRSGGQGPRQTPGSLAISQKMLRLYEAGFSYRQIADRYAISFQSVYHRLHKLPEFRARPRGHHSTGGTNEET